MVSPLLGAALIALTGLRSMFVLVSAIFVLVALLATSHRSTPPLQRNRKEFSSAEPDELPVARSEARSRLPGERGAVGAVRWPASLLGAPFHP
jgi:hypothetical protein